MTLELFLASLLTSLVGATLGAGLTGYWREKGKNLATQEDIANITHQIETVKTQLALASSLQTFRYQKEFELLLQLSNLLAPVREATLALRPLVELVDLKEGQEDRAKRKVQELGNLGNKLYDFLAGHRPFIPLEIVQEIDSFIRVSKSELIDFQHPSAFDTRREYYEAAKKTAGELASIVEEIESKIRSHVRLWELEGRGPQHK